MNNPINDSEMRAHADRRYENLIAIHHDAEIRCQKCHVWIARYWAIGKEITHISVQQVGDFQGVMAEHQKSLGLKLRRNGKPLNFSLEDCMQLHDYDLIPAGCKCHGFMNLTLEQLREVWSTSQGSFDATPSGRNYVVTKKNTK